MATETPDSRNVTAFPLVSGDDTEAEALTAVIRRLTSAQSLPEIMEIITHAARVLLGADGITFVVREGERCYYAEEDAIGPLWKGRRFPMSACISGWCMEHGRAVAIPDIYEDERIPHDAYRPTFVKSLAMVPVRQEDPIAALGAYWARSHHASAEELELLQTAANAAALSIAYVQLREATTNSAWRALKSRSLLLVQRRPNRLNVWSPSSGFLWAQRAKDVGVGMLVTAGALLIRLAFDPVVAREVPYATFYAAVVLAVIWRGWVAGATAVVAGGLAANLVFIAPVGTLSLSTSNAWALFIYSLVASLLLVVTQRVVETSQREREMNRKLQLVRGELQHRIKNFVTVVQALAVQTGRSSVDAADFDAKFTKRLRALAVAQGLLDDPKHSSAGLAMLIERTLSPFDVADRVQIISAPEVRIGEDVAVALALILNELATNALKYGSLSTAEGTVRIECDRVGKRARLIWSEHDGPRVSRPARSGFGTRLIHSALSAGHGRAEVEYQPDGLRCQVEFGCLSH